MKYVGLTDEPDRRRAEQGDPPDWWHTKFRTEIEARNWETRMRAIPGYKGGPGGDGWQYGYMYTMGPGTRD